MYSYQKRTIRNSVIAAVLAGSIIGGGVMTYNALHPERNVTFTVSDKERVCDGGKNGTCKYLIYTNKGTFEDTDTLIKGKFNSSDVYGSIHPNTTYTAKVRGIRYPIFSWYPNIIEIDPVK